MDKRKYTREEAKAHAQKLLEKLKNVPESPPGWCGTPRILSDLYLQKEKKLEQEQGEKK